MSFSDNWKKLSGEDQWCLLDPLNVDLRRSIIHYGQMAGACGDLFKSGMRVDANGDLHVVNESTSKISKEDFFKKACLEKGNEHKYKVTKFFEATTPTSEPAWFGYVAVSDGKDAEERIDILIAWRGPVTNSEWKTNTVCQLNPSSEYGQEEAKVHAGFASLFAGVLEDRTDETTTARKQVRDAVSELLEEHKDKDISITVTGFSLGAALATMSALDLVVNGYNKPKSNPDKSCMVTAFVFGSPPIGNDGFKKAVDDNNSKLHILRIENSADLVLKYVSEKLGEAGYMHVGGLLKVDSSKSHYLEQRASTISVPPFLAFDTCTTSITQDSFQPDHEWLSSHNLDVYLHAVASVQKGKLCLPFDHDIALVNKHLDLLKDVCGIPPSWWEGPNREKMYQLDNGRWEVKAGSYRRGDGNWCLLDPPSVDLRRYIIHYGQMVGACGDLFKTGMRAGDEDLYLFDNGEKKTQVTKEDFFQKACLEKGNQHKYKVTKFIEAASGTVEPAWFGYVAVSDGEAAMGRLDILISWRGTATTSEWISNSKVSPLSYTNIFGNEQVKVHAGFVSVYAGVRQEPPHNVLASARHQVLLEVERVLDLEEHRDKEISITVMGFSLGAALATINALDLVVNGYNKPKSNPNKSCMVTAFVFGGPHVGNREFKKAVDDNNSNLHILRITNRKDPVPKLLAIGESSGSYVHVGKVLRVDSSISPYLKPTILSRSLDSSDPVIQFLSSDEDDLNDRTGRGITESLNISTILARISPLFSSHNMDLYLHAVAGFQGSSQFSLSVDLDTALINKYTDLLNDNRIPVNWWDGPNRRRMCQKNDGRWMVKAAEEDSCPPGN